MLDKFEARRPKGARRMAHCTQCGHRTIHGVEVECNSTWDEGDGYFGGTDYHVLRCGGCDAVRYLTESWDNSAYEEDEDGKIQFIKSEKLFPPPTVRKLSVDHHFYVPWKLNKVLEEVLDAQAANHLILATIGVRLLIESFCKVIGCKGGLAAMINQLETKSLITEDEKDLFHEVRKYGNQGAHAGEAMSADQIASALDISIHLIETQFVEPEKKKKLYTKAKALLKSDDGTDGAGSAKKAVTKASDDKPAKA